MADAAIGNDAPQERNERTLQGSQRVLQNGILNLAGQVLYAGLQVVVIVVLVRQLGGPGLGRYYTLVATILTAQLVIEGGAGSVLTQRLTNSGTSGKSRIDEATGLFGIISLLSAGAFFVAGAVWICIDVDLPWLICLLFAGVSCGAMQLQRFCISVFQASELFRYENVAKILQIALFLLLLFGLLAADAVSLHGVFLAHAISHIAAALYLYDAMRRHTGPLVWLLDWRAALRQWVEAAPLGIADVLRKLIWQVDTIILAVLTTPGVVGVYSVAYRALGPLNWIPRALLSAAFPSLARTAGDREKTSRVFVRSTRLLFVVSIPLAVAICACAKLLVEILAGPEFEQAAVLMQILIWTIVLSFMSVQFRFLFAAINRERAFAGLAALVLLLKIAIEVVMIPRLGYYGACFGSLAAEVIFFGGGLVLCRSLGIAGIQWRAALRALFAGLVMAALLWTVRDGGPVLLGVTLVFAAMLYTALCAALGAVKRDEIQQCFLLVRRLFRLPAKNWSL